ncbi:MULTISPECIES: M28 family peptidase [unclassified Robiginitalea]|uniref:M28 family peptidase n=1 Tax=Robiginitalea TaxID=252306 RepID=UPI00234B069B|nr:MULTISPECIES: M28 family peptidase [unclassified Robiginitalea]MDC6353900.1 M28 family peptidase [Robiginitalea sp. PM2]MDC6374167.1 M28 family peptidase [Robiginitalea sp. SP8]
MQKVLLLCAALAVSCNSTQQSVAEHTALASPDEITYASTITEEELKEHLYTYASDAFEGRETGTPGQKKAVEYLENAYREMEVAPALGDAGYLQKVPLELARLPTGSITINGADLKNGEGFLTFSPGTGHLDEVVFVGYGIETPGYSDYRNMDVEGKYLLMKAGEPRKADGTYLISGTNKESGWSNLSEGIDKRQAVARSKGARGFFYVDDANFARYKRYFDRMQRNNSGRMGLASPENSPQMLVVQSDVAAKIYPGFEKNTVAEVYPVDIDLNVDSKSEAVDSENVIAYIPGSVYPNEYLVISSHLDHIGVSSDGAINNGADDDGSGTVAMLEIAEAFKKAAEDGKGPKRSVVFLHVTGEEKGLLGSQYYTDYSPAFPLEQTVANLNIDMIGRIDPKREGNRNYIYLIGSDKLSTDLHKLSEAVNEKYSGLELDYTYNDENDPNRFYYRSDHYNFAKNNIPIIFYFNGTHVDYHRPGDTPDKINYDLLENRTRLIFHTAWEIANRDTRVIVDKPTR